MNDDALNFMLSFVLIFVVNLLAAKLSIHAHSSDANNFYEVVHAIPHDESYAYEGLGGDEIMVSDMQVFITACY